MSLWNLFTKNDQNKNDLEEEIKLVFPSLDEVALTKVTALCGLFASIVYADLKIETQEIEAFKREFVKWVSLEQNSLNHLVKVSIDYAKQLVGVDTHLYAKEVKDLMNEDEKYYLLESLFTLAASDGNTSLDESELIKLISKNLGLSNQMYLSARAKFLDSLGEFK
ncbi:MAG: TerB family tellurite resistance protein [Bacteriovoracaceae bacterium]|jgi:uncharacterized tellurite resistance protein B-like protein|nr:TerB family tellurite resistance protein [Bacteriovoracaceae bacterium]